jgi:hypothetical protein
MDIGSILGAVASGASGGIFGGVLGLGQLWLKGKQEEKRAARELERLKLEQAHDLALMDKEAERARLEANIALDKADLANLGETVRGQDAEIKAMNTTLKGAWPWVRSLAALLFTGVTVIQKTIRPALTVALVVCTWYIFGRVQALVGGLPELPAGELMAIYKYIIYSILSLTGTAVAFWFTTRFQGPKK